MSSCASCGFSPTCFIVGNVRVCVCVCGERVVQHFPVCTVAAVIHEERARSVEIACDICYELVVPAGQRFGLLEHCTHAFCLNCIREWRHKMEQGQRKEAVRACPVCRVESHFIVPCDRFIADAARKATVFGEYKTSMRKIPCTHWNMGKGTCPFGTSCFYAHLNPVRHSGDGWCVFVYVYVYVYVYVHVCM